MAPAAAAALPLIGKGVAAGAASFGASKVLGKLFGKDDEEQEAAQKETAAPLAAPNPYQQVGTMAPMNGVPMMAPTMMVPAAAGIAGAGAGIITAAPPATAQSAPATAASEGGGAAEKDSFLGSASKILMAAGAGGIGGFVLKNKEAQEHGLEGGAKFAELAKGVLAGAGSGAFTKMGYDAVQEEGGGLKAGLNGGIAGMLASTLKEGGPGLGASFTTAFGAGAVSNLAHDKLEQHGSSKLADAVAGGGIASSLGYVGLGDGKAAGLLGMGGAGLGTALGALDSSGGLKGMLAEGNPLDKLTGLIGNGSAPEKDSGPSLG